MARRKTYRLAHWLSETSTPLFLLDEKRKVLFFNQGCEALTGWTAADTIGKVCDYVSQGTTEDVSGLLGSLCPPPDILDSLSQTVPATIITKKGGALPRSIHFFTLGAESGQEVHVLGIIGPRIERASPSETIVSTRELHAELNAIRSTLRKNFRIDVIIARSPAMSRVLRQAHNAISVRSAVHLTGERGTGREFLARTIHYAGPERLTAFVPIDCEQLSSHEIKRTLLKALESPPPGDAHIPARQVGALLLKSVTQMPRDVQQLLIDALDAAESEQRTIPRLFSSDCRPLQVAVEQEQLLEPLYFALSTMEISLPPLRKRQEDFEYLGQMFLEQENRDRSKQIGGFTQDVWHLFRQYRWPGNLREFQQTIAEAYAASQGPFITVSDLPFRFRTGLDAQRVGPAEIESAVDLRQHLDKMERRIIEQTLRRCGFNKSRAAELLGLTRPKLYRRIEQLGIIERPELDD